MGSLIKRNKIMKRILCMTVVFTLLLNIFSGFGIAFAQEEQGDFTINQGFSKDYYLSGLMTTTNEYFSVEDWDIDKAEFTLVLSTTQLAEENLSDLTVSINSVRFYSERVPATDGEKREIVIEVPLEHIKEGANLITIETYIRTTDGLPCVDDVATANWANIFKESSVKLDYSMETKCNTISQFYSNFVSIHALYHELSTIVINPNYDEAELACALKVMAGVSAQSSKYYDNIELNAYANKSEYSDNEFVIYVAKEENLPDEFKSAASEKLKDADEGEGILVLSQGDINYLIVTARDDEGLDKAVKVLMNEPLISQVKSNSLKLSANGNVYTREIEYEQNMQFAPNGKYIKGPFRQVGDFYIDNPSNRMLATGSDVSVDMRYAENIDFDRSLVTVYIDDVPIGSRKLFESKTDGDNITVQIPSDLNVAGPFKLTVAFDLEVKDLWCTLRQPNTPWAYVTDDSYMDIKYMDIPYFLFEYYPSPFISEGTFNDVVIVVPDENKSIQVDALGKIMNVIGRSVKGNRGSIEVLRAGEVKKEELNEKMLLFMVRIMIIN